MERLHEDDGINDFMLANYNLEDATMLAKIARQYEETARIPAEESHSTLLKAVKGFEG